MTDGELTTELADMLMRIEANYDREGSGPGSRFEGQRLEVAQAAAILRRLREYGLLSSPDEVRLKVWRARNMNGDRCRWCGALRGETSRSHRAGCRFYDGPVTHAFHSGHMGSFDYWVRCACGTSYPEHGTDGSKQECPDRELTWKHPKEPDLLAPAGSDAP